MKMQIIWFAAFCIAIGVSACSGSTQTLLDPVTTPEVEIQIPDEIPETSTGQIEVETPAPPPATATDLPVEEIGSPEISFSNEAEVTPTTTTALDDERQNEPSEEKMVLEDPANWDLKELRPDPDNPDLIFYSLNKEQIQMAVEPIRNFYNGMYYSERLLTIEEASQWIDTTSQAWTDKEQGFQASHDSFASFGYYPRYEFSIEDPTYFTEWDIYAANSPEGDVYVQVKFRIEEQLFTVLNQASGEVIVSNPYWGPRLAAFQTAFRDGRWKIIFRHEENLGMKTIPTPSQ
jgi:hypothetical protein